MKFILFFESLTDSKNKGFVKRIRKTGFTGVNNEDLAKRMNYKQVIQTLDNLYKQKELEFYNFTIKKVNKK